MREWGSHILDTIIRPVFVWLRGLPDTLPNVVASQRGYPATLDTSCSRYSRWRRKTSQAIAALLGPVRPLLSLWAGPRPGSALLRTAVGPGTART